MIALALRLARRVPFWGWIALAAWVVLLTTYAAFKYQQHRADTAVIEARSAKASSKALERVATQTPIIIADQEEKSRAADQIQGADDRLPAGYGASLERVRRGNRADDPR